MAVLWFTDRFGIRGEYRSIWLQLLNNVGIRPTSVRVVSLHEELPGRLLTKFGSRSAPTWEPTREADILARMGKLVKEMGAGLEAVVLAAPESLCALRLQPEHCTLGKLRGSVYDTFGVPTLVVLPMSAWTTQVSQRDVAMANYGLTSQDALTASADATDVTPESETFDSDGESEATEEDTADEDDTFFYVPVMTPVGKMMIQFDVAKLGRLVTGKAGEHFKPV